jgi:heavy metal efflux system protein
MIEKIIKFSVRNPLTIAIFTFLLASWGAYSLYNLPIDAVPDVTSNQVDVITLSPSLASLEIEQFITAPIEMSMSNLPGLVEMRSISKFGLSVVKLVFKDDVNIYLARQQVFERLEAVQSEIPAELGKPYMGPVSTGLGEVFQYSIRAKDPKDKSFTPMEIRTLQDWVIRKQLLGIPGIAEVSGFGGYKKEYQAKIKSDRMRALNVTIDDLFEALSKGNSNTGGAYVEKNNKAFTIRGLGLATSLEEVANTVVKVNDRVPILVKDVADVEFGNSIRYGAMTQDAQGEVVGGVIMMMKGENGSAVIGRIKERMKKIEASLPEGLVIEPFIDREKLVSKAISTVRTNLIEGAIIVVLVILLFLGNWRASLLAASVIPLSMLFAFGLMQQFGVVGNLMSLGAIDFGLLVDPAIIVVESVVLFLALAMGKKAKGEKMTYQERQEVVISATAEVKKSVIFGGLIILIVYVPLMTLSGIEGKMFIPMAKTVSFAIMGALLLAITYIPMMCALVIKPPKSAHHSGISEIIVNFLYRIYKPLLVFGLRYKFVMVLLAFGVLFAGGIGFSRIGGEFIPKLAEGDLVLDMSLPIGTSLTESIQLSEKIQRVLQKAFPDEIERIVSKIGTSEVPVDPMPLEAQEIVVVLKDKKYWKKAHDQEALVVEFDKVMKQFPGLILSIQQPIENRVNEMMSGARTDVVVKLFGPNLDTLVKKGNQVISIVKTIEGATDVQENKIFGLPQINIKYNREQMAVHGITVAQINRAINVAYAGAIAGIVYENDKRFDLTIRLSNEDREKAEDLGNLSVSDKDGLPIPLNQLATITENIGPSEIGHEDMKRRANIGFNVRGRDLESVVKDAMKEVNQKVLLPPGYTIEFGGEFENYRRASERLAIVVPIALLIILGLLYATFGNLKDSLLIYTVVPLSAVGGVFSLLFRDMNFSISAGVGFIALFGVAVLNGILIIGQISNLEKQGIKNLNRRILMGVSDRFRPILMTSAVAALGFLPMALSSSAGAEVQKPLATVVIGGLFTAMVLTLLVLPVLYAIFNAPKQNTTAGKTPKLAQAVAVIALLLMTYPLAAQERISVDEAVNRALNKNPEMKLADQKIQKEVALRPAMINLDNPSLIFEAPTGRGQRPGLMQTFQYPGVYSAQIRAQKTRVNLSETEKQINRNSLVYRVKTTYTDLQFLLEKVKLLRGQDSVYSDILRVNEVRYKVGQISNLEKINGESQYKRIQYNRAQAEADLRNAKYQLSYLLGSPSDTAFVPNEKFQRGIAPVALTESDTTLFENNPLTNYNRQSRLYNQQLLRAEKRRQLPGLALGYLDQGDTREGQITPVQYRLQFGITLPIWYWVKRANVNAAKKNVEMAQTQAQITNYQLGTELSKAIADYRQNNQNLEYFETVGIKQAEEIIRDSRENYRLGTIGYYAYLQNLELAYQIELNYLESLKKYNQSIININYLKGTL